MRRFYPVDRVTADIPKGDGFGYKATAFSALPPELREVAMHYERLLTDLRKAGHENRTLCRTMTNTLARAGKVIHACDVSLSAGKSLREALQLNTHEETAKQL